MLKDVTVNQNKHLILSGDLNIFFDTTLEGKGGNPILKRKAVSKLTEIKVSLGLCDIWKIRNPSTQRYTFRQKHFPGFMQRRLDYIFISNSFQEFVNNTDILPALSSDHFPVFLIISDSKYLVKGPGFWKFNSSLILDHDYVTKTEKGYSRF